MTTLMKSDLISLKEGPLKPIQEDRADPLSDYMSEMVGRWRDERLDGGSGWENEKDSVQDITSTTVLPIVSDNARSSFNRDAKPAVTEIFGEICNNRTTGKRDDRWGDSMGDQCKSSSGALSGTFFSSDALLESLCNDLKIEPVSKKRGSPSRSSSSNQKSKEEKTEDNLSHQFTNMTSRDIISRAESIVSGKMVPKVKKKPSRVARRNSVETSHPSDKGIVNCRSAMAPVCPVRLPSREAVDRNEESSQDANNGSANHRWETEQSNATNRVRRRTI